MAEVFVLLRVYDYEGCAVERVYASEASANAMVSALMDHKAKEPMCVLLEDSTDAECEAWNAVYTEWMAANPMEPGSPTFGDSYAVQRQEIFP